MATRNPRATTGVAGATSLQAGNAKSPRDLYQVSGAVVWVPCRKAMACVDSRPAGQARSVACRTSRGHILFDLTAIVAVGPPRWPWQGTALCIHPDCLRITVRKSSGGGRLRGAGAGIAVGRSRDIVPPQRATELEGGAGTPERWFGSGPVRLTGGSLESPGSGFSSQYWAMGHRSSGRLMPAIRTRADF
jgi:hypothetical protein